MNLIYISKHFSPSPSWESITFQPAEAGPDNKPQRPFGVSDCASFHCSPQLLKFVQATNVKITLSGHTLVTHPDHKYFGIRRILVAGRYVLVYFFSKDSYFNFPLFDYESAIELFNEHLICSGKE